MSEKLENKKLKIDKEKDRYLEFAQNNSGKRLYIFGAGRQAVPIAEFLISKGVIVDGFCVSKKEDNKKQECGLPILQLSEIHDEDQGVAFIIGVRKSLNNEVIRTIRERGYTNYLESSDLSRLIGEYGNNFYFNPMMEITTKLGCEVNCKYCPQDVFIKEYVRTGGASKTLSFNDYKICVDKLPKEVLIEFAGFTEPFFNKECMNMIDYAIEKGHSVNVFTTLRGVDIKMAQELSKMEFGEFVVHVPDMEGYSNIPITEEYIDVLCYLKNKQKRNGKCFIDYACSQGTIPAIVKKILQDEIRVYVVLNDRAGNIKDESLYHKKGVSGRIRCELSYDINHNVLLPDGRVILCSNDWAMMHVLGNLKTQTYQEVIYGDVANSVRKQMVEDRDNILCRNCFQAVKDMWV